MFYDHPLLGLYFLGDASDGSTSGQLGIPGTGLCSNPNAGFGQGNPANLNAIPIFQGLPINDTSLSNPCIVSTNPAVASLLNYDPNQQRFSCPVSDQSCGVTPIAQSIFLGQNYLNPSTFMPFAFQPFGYPQGKNFVYAYAQQANLTIERHVGRGFAFNLGYNFNGGRHLNHPINASAVRGDLLVANWQAAYSDPTSYAITGGPLGVGSGPTAQGFAPCGVNPS